MLDKTKQQAPSEKAGIGAPAIEIISVSKWHGSVAQIERRFVHNESLQMLIELVLSIRHVKDHRKGSVKDRPLEALLKKLSLTIERGSVVGIIDIGSRSRDTLIRILSNGEAPAAGAVHFFGKLAAFNQLGASDFPHLTCRQNLEFGAKLVGIPRRDISAAVARVPEFSGLGEHLDTPIRRLNKLLMLDIGVSFLCCLDYDIMVADEISRPRCDQVAAAWRDYVQRAPKRGKTVIATSMNTVKLKGVCTHLLLIKDAELLAYGRAEEIEAEHADFIAEAQATPKTEEAGSSASEEDDDDEIM